MFERYLDLSDKVSPILIRQAGDNVPKPLMGEEIIIANELMQLLRPFYHATSITSGQTYLTGSKALPLIKNLKKNLELIPTKTKPSEKLKTLLMNEFDKRFKNCESLYSISAATILDPRYKKLYFENYLACSKF